VTARTACGVATRPAGTDPARGVLVPDGEVLMRAILVASDFSESSAAALRRARLLAAARGARIVLVHAFDGGRGRHPRDAGAAMALDEERRAAEIRLEAERRELVAAGLEAIAMRLDGPAGEVIPAAARAEAVDLVVVGSRGRSGVKRILLGSVAEKVVRTSPVPVLVARGAAEAPFRRALVATDLGEPAERALAAALELVEPPAALDLVHLVALEPVVGIPVRPLVTTALAAVTEEARRAAGELAARHAREGVAVAVACEIADPRDGVLDRLEAGGHDLVAVGSHGRHGVARALLGSVSETIVRHAPCSVLVAR
jgi:nucleotide-binding universal stress UspA family protein